MSQNPDAMFSVGVGSAGSQREGQPLFLGAVAENNRGCSRKHCILLLSRLLLCGWPFTQLIRYHLPTLSLSSLASLPGAMGNDKPSLHAARGHNMKATVYLPTSKQKGIQGEKGKTLIFVFEPYEKYIQRFKPTSLKYLGWELVQTKLWK